MFNFCKYRLKITLNNNNSHSHLVVMRVSDNTLLLIAVSIMCRMSFDQFVSIFSTLDLVHLTADAFGGDAIDGGSSRAGETGPVKSLAGRIKQCWSMDKEFSFWRSNVSAGGSDPVC